MSILDNLSDDERAALLQELEQRQGTPDPEFDEGEEASTETRSAVARNAAPNTSQPVNVWGQAAQEFERDIANGDTQDTALAKAISKINYAGQSTDPKIRDQVDAKLAQERINAEGARRDPNPTTFIQ